jgi:hypothetical protein
VKVGNHPLRVDNSGSTDRMKVLQTAALAMVRAVRSVLLGFLHETLGLFFLSRPPYRLASFKVVLYAVEAVAWVLEDLSPNLMLRPSKRLVYTPMSGRPYLS